MRLTNRETILSSCLRFEFISSNTCPNLHEEDDTEQNGEGEGHAVVLLDGPAAAKEGDEEDDTSHDDEEDWGREELVSKEVKILTVGPLDHTPCHNQEQARELEL